MFFYNVMKETIRMKYVWLSILFLLNVSIIGCLFNYFEPGIVKEKMNELESTGRIRFVEDPRDSRRKLISKNDVEEVVKALTTI